MGQLYKYIISFSLAAIAIPYTAHAQTTLFTILGAVLVAINLAIPVVVSLAILLFLWGLAKYIFRTDTVEGKEAAKSIMVWGIVTIFVMVALWGFVNLLQVLSGVDDLSSPIWPQIGP